MPWVISSSAHTIVTSTIRSSEDQGHLRNFSSSNSINKLSTVFSNTFMFEFLSDHETSDVLEEKKRNSSLSAQFDEMGSLLSRFREQDAIVGNNSDFMSVKSGETVDQGVAVKFFEFQESRNIIYAGL